MLVTAAQEAEPNGIMEANAHAATNGHAAPHRAVSSPPAALPAAERLSWLIEHEPLLLAAGKAADGKHALRNCYVPW